MPWLLLDVAVVLVALAAAGVCGLRLWRGVKALGREVGAAGTSIGVASDALARVQAGAPAQSGAGTTRAA